MKWTQEDSEDVKSALAKCAEVREMLVGDLTSRQVRHRTRRAIDAAMQALLALDDVYFENDDGSPVPEAWRRAKFLLRPA